MAMLVRRRGAGGLVVVGDPMRVAARRIPSTCTYRARASRVPLDLT